MKRLAINSGDAFILVYSVDDPQSFDDLEQLRQTILNEREQAYLEASASTTSNDSLASSSLASGTSLHSSSMTGNTNNNHTNNQNHSQSFIDPIQAGDVLSSRPWSLASLFNAGSHATHQHNNHMNSYHNNQHQTNHTIAGLTTNSSLSSSICSSSCSSTDNSRRSSISAAEAALKTRRTRHPPIVIVANKCDLPDEKHHVDSDEIEALAVIDWNNGFVRASAAFNWNINEIFQQVLKQARQPPTLTEAIISKRRKSLPPKLPH